MAGSAKSLAGGGGDTGVWGGCQREVTGGYWREAASGCQWLRWCGGRRRVDMGDQLRLRAAWAPNSEARRRAAAGAWVEGRHRPIMPHPPIPQETTQSTTTAAHL